MDHVQSLLAKPRNQTGRQITQPSNNQSPHCHALCEGEVAGSRSRADAKIVHKNEDTKQKLYLHLYLTYSPINTT